MVGAVMRRETGLGYAVRGHRVRSAIMAVTAARMRLLDVRVRYQRQWSRSHGVPRASVQPGHS
jgi:hypothetical protein